MSCFEKYNTERYISINSKIIGGFYYGILFSIPCFFLIYVFIFHQEYLETDTGMSALTIKVKGASFVNKSANVWDVADLVVPPQEDEAFFITTKIEITRKQSRNKCTGAEGASCKNDSDCVPFQQISTGDGVKTGKCIRNNSCEVYAWCPIESSQQNSTTTETILLESIENLSVILKNNIYFRQFDYLRTSVPTENTSFPDCRFDPDNNLICPIFNISTILKLAGIKYENISVEGGFVFIQIAWDCSIYTIKNCFPTYKFIGLPSDKGNISKGWNFRYAHYYYANDTLNRDLLKATGIRFTVSVVAKATRFSFLKTLLTVGSCLAIFSGFCAVFKFIVMNIIFCNCCCCKCCKTSCSQGCIKCCEPGKIVQDINNNRFQEIYGADDYIIHKIRCKDQNDDANHDGANRDDANRYDPNFMMIQND